MPANMGIFTSTHSDTDICELCFVFVLCFNAISDLSPNTPSLCKCHLERDKSEELQKYFESIFKCFYIVHLYYIEFIESERVRGRENWKEEKKEWQCNGCSQVSQDILPDHTLGFWDELI